MILYNYWELESHILLLSNIDRRSTRLVVTADAAVIVIPATRGVDHVVVNLGRDTF